MVGCSFHNTKDATTKLQNSKQRINLLIKDHSISSRPERRNLSPEAFLFVFVHLFVLIRQSNWPAFLTAASTLCGSWDVDSRSSQWWVMCFTSEDQLLLWQTPQEMWDLPILLIWLSQGDPLDPVWSCLESKEIVPWVSSTGEYSTNNAHHSYQRQLETQRLQSDQRTSKASIITKQSFPLIECHTMCLFHGTNFRKPRHYYIYDTEDSGISPDNCFVCILWIFM